MRIAVFGGKGQVATELLRRVPDGVTVERIGREVADFTVPEQVYQAAKALEADAAINAVAYTAVDTAESEPELAKRVNGTSVGRLAEGCAEAGVPLVHLSTDYVFPGDGDEARAPDAATGPLNAYGASKLAGEKAIAASKCRAVILRTSWVFSAHGGNFVRTMLRLAETRDKLTIVDDQIGGPTSAADIADACFTIASALARGAAGGTHHFAGTPDVSWAGFACEIFAQAGLEVDVQGIPTQDYPTPAQRPLNSRLDCTSLAEAYGISRPDWRRGLSDVLKELTA